MTNNISFLKISPRVLIVAGIVAMALVGVCIPLFTNAATLNRQLEIGMSGADVSLLQTFLAQDSTIYPQGLVTGYFGPLTQAAVSKFQARNGIATVGRVGPVTLVAINAQMDSGSKTGFDRISPIVSSISVSTDKTAAMFNWNTSEPSSAIIYYSPSPLVMMEGGAGSDVSVSGQTLLVHSDMRSSHSGTVSGLQQNTTYYYVLYVRDSSGNVTVTQMSTFKTAN
jgi:hypothetical protein